MSWIISTETLSQRLASSIMELQQSSKEMKMKMKLQAKFNTIDLSIRRNTLTNSYIGSWKNDNKNKNEKCTWNFGELGFVKGNDMSTTFLQHFYNKS